MDPKSDAQFANDTPLRPKCYATQGVQAGAIQCCRSVGALADSLPKEVLVLLIFIPQANQGVYRNSNSGMGVVMEGKSLQPRKTENRVRMHRRVGDTYKNRISTRRTACAIDDIRRMETDARDVLNCAPLHESLVNLSEMASWIRGELQERKGSGTLRIERECRSVRGSAENEVRT
ncbi:hypothetical protein BD779DRAFT_1476651 [Infundibulicybe gibba]|nr:hypothetical protein BD779DRAFT_1476955 [Infundibulicybe gibba]KAF8874121.1 hypothetical protein BD779DRAFT_1476651 [Infundibulicybe gibba]